MTKMLCYARWAGIAVVGVLSPAIIALGVPFAYGIACDVVQNACLTPIALVLATAIAVNARRRDALTRRDDAAAKALYPAAKSMT